MVEEPSAGLVAEMQRTQAAAPRDKLDRVRAAVRRLRDLILRKDQANELIREISREVVQIEQRDLVDLFDEAGVTKISLPPEGNLPGLDAKSAPYYYANIAADWPEDKREAGFRWLEDHGCGDLIKTVVTVELGLGEAEKTAAVVKALREVGAAFDVKKSVPWTTLTAFVKEKSESSDPLSEEDCAAIGARVGRIVKVSKSRLRGG